MLLLVGCLLLGLAGCQGCQNPTGPSTSTPAMMNIRLVVAMTATQAYLSNAHVWVTTTGGGDEEIYNAPLTITSASVISSGALLGCYYWQSDNSSSHPKGTGSAVFNFSYTGATQSIYYTVNEVANGASSVVTEGSGPSGSGTSNY
jgi:hypothetical protein